MPKVSLANATYLHGKNTVVLLDDYDLTAYWKQANKSASFNQVTANAFGNNYSRKVQGMGDATMSFAGFFSPDANGPIDALGIRLGAKARTNVMIGNASLANLGAPCQIGLAFPTKFDTTNDSEQVVGIAYDLGSDGGFFSGKSLVPYGGASTAITASVTTGPSVDDGANIGGPGNVTSTGGWIASYHVVNNSLSVGCTVKLQDSADGMTFADLAGSTFATTATLVTDSQLLRVDNATVRRYVRAVITLGMTPTGQADIAVGFARLPLIQ